MDVAEAASLISRAIDAGRAAHGYLIVGDVKGNAAELVREILRKLFPDEIGQVEKGEHPDVVTLEPSGKSRTIKVARTDTDPTPGMREKVIEPMSTTSFSGGWKVAIIVSADRLRVEAANAFLKLLEEPPPKTMFLLLTDQPDVILPTIVSRTQRIDLKLPPGILEGDDYEEVAALFAAKDAAGLAEKFAALKDEAEDEDVALVRKTFYRTLMSFVRAQMTSSVRAATPSSVRAVTPRPGVLPPYQAFRNIEAVEEAYRRSEKSLNDDAVLSALLDKIAF